MTTQLFSTTTGLECTLTTSMLPNGGDASLHLSILNASGTSVKHPALTLTLPKETMTERATAITSSGWCCTSDNNTHSLQPTAENTPLNPGDTITVTLAGLKPTADPSAVTEILLDQEQPGEEQVLLPLNLSTVEPIAYFAPESDTYKKGDDIILTASLLDGNEYTYILEYANNASIYQIPDSELRKHVGTASGGRLPLSYTVKSNTVSDMLTTFTLQAVHEEGGGPVTATSSRAILLDHGDINAGDLTINGSTQIFGPQDKFGTDEKHYKKVDYLADTDGFIFCTLSPAQSLMGETQTTDIVDPENADSQAEMLVKLTYESGPVERYNLKAGSGSAASNTNLTIPIKSGTTVSCPVPASGELTWVPLGHRE